MGSIPTTQIMAKDPTEGFRELEKKFSGKHIVILAQRRILPKPTRKTKNQKQKRPFSRTLTSVHNAILDDLCFPAEIVGKRTRVRLDPPDFSRSTSTKPCRLMLNTNWKLSATSTRNSPERKSYSSSQTNSKLVIL